MSDCIITRRGGSSKEEQEKSVTITTNGTTEVTPDNDKTLSKVTAVVNVPSSGGIPVSVHSITPSTSATVTTPVVTVTERSE